MPKAVSAGSRIFGFAPFFDKHLAGYVQELNTLAGSMTRRSSEPEKKFIVFGRGRSGSTLLVRLLNAHPDVACQGEILRRPLVSPEAYARRKMAQGLRKASGFKLLSHHLRSVNPQLGGRDFLLRLSDEGWLIIYLKRRDPFRHALSLVYARKRGAFNSDNPKAHETRRVVIEPEELLGVIEASEEHERYEASVLSGLDSENLIYEDHLEAPADQAKTVARIFTRLEVPGHDVEATLKRVTPKALSDFVLNAEELRAALRETRFAPFVVNAV